MRISGIATKYYRLPREIWARNLPIAGSLYSISHVELVTVDVATDAGVSGFGFTYTVGHGGSAIHALLRDEIQPGLVGEECNRVEALWSELSQRLHWVGRGGLVSTAIAAADIALWDCLARERDLPLHTLLGSHRDSIPAYGSGVNLGYSVEQLLDEVRAFCDRGFDAVKVKIGLSAEEDAERVRAVREAVGDRCRVMVDANMAWSLDEAARRLKSLEEYDIAWFEEPLSADNVQGHAALQLTSPVPIAAGESLFTPPEFLAYFRSAAIRVAQPDVTRLGITGWRRVATIAAAFHVPVAPHFLPDLHVHLACAAPNAVLIEYLPWFDRVFTDALELEGGIAHPSSKPGHGLELDLRLLAPFLVESSES
jgi:L-alanine-DL-glutamate epimerase-like enolase superfamily enzyme